MKNNIYNQILEHFETADGALTIEQSYDMTSPGAMDNLERESAEAWRAVRDLSLNYNIEAKHSARRVDLFDGQEEIDEVNVTWVFWK